MPAAATAERSGGAVGFASAEELREVLTALLGEIDSESELGTRMRSARVSYRYVFPDLGLTLTVASSDERDHNVRWSFADDPELQPRLTLEMSSVVANLYLQGAENLAIAMARGRIRCSGESRAALDLLPISSQLAACYRRVLERDFPHLLLH
jgi:hypothetical protein